MDTIRVTRGEFQRAFDAMSDRALQEPVTITKAGRDHLVVMSADEYARLKRRDRRVGLDMERSWVVISEWNEFVWPGPDLRRALGGDVRSVAYGMLPPGLFISIRDQFLALVRARHGGRVERTE